RLLRYLAQVSKKNWRTWSRLGLNIKSPWASRLPPLPLAGEGWGEGTRHRTHRTPAFAGRSGLGRRRLVLVLAQVGDDAFGALRLPRLAHVAAVQDQPVMGVDQEFLRHHAHELLFHLQHGLARGEAGAVGDAEDVGVDRHRR